MKGGNDMSTSKRLVALLMAIVMVLGLFAMTASATSGIICVTCYNKDRDGTSFTRRETGSWNTVNPRRVTGCSHMTGYHYHYDKVRTTSELCTKHGIIREYNEWQYDLCFGG